MAHSLTSAGSCFNADCPGKPESDICSTTALAAEPMERSTGTGVYGLRMSSGDLEPKPLVYDVDRCVVVAVEDCAARARPLPDRQRLLPIPTTAH